MKGATVPIKDERSFASDVEAGGGSVANGMSSPKNWNSLHHSSGVTDVSISLLILLYLPLMFVILRFFYAI